MIDKVKTRATKKKGYFFGRESLKITRYEQHMIGVDHCMYKKRQSVTLINAFFLL